MQELKARREKCLVDAADCELIANLATDRQMPDDIGAEIVRREGRDAA